MNLIPEFNSSVCRSNEKATTVFDGASGRTWIHPEKTLEFKMDAGSASATVEFTSVPDRAALPLSSLEAVFATNTALKTLFVKKAPMGFAELFPHSEGVTEVRRDEFFQLPFLWHAQNTLELKPERWTVTKTAAQEVSHPARPRVEAGQVLYKRYVPQIQKTLTFRVPDPEKDLDVFHDWQNQERVFTFWELNKSKPELKDYLKKALQDPHQFPAILDFDGVPVGYFEIYWTKEDRLGPYYEADAYDRGFHFLVGDASYLGFKNTDALLATACHYIFLDEPRTRKIMGEPRSDNKKLLKYVDTLKCWRNVKTFEFPHKQACLLECKRELFFMENYL